MNVSVILQFMITDVFMIRNQSITGCEQSHPCSCAYKLPYKIITKQNTNRIKVVKWLDFVLGFHGLAGGLVPLYAFKKNPIFNVH